MSFSIFSQRFALGAFLFTSIAGCIADPSDPEYAFGEADVQKAIVGKWSGMMSLTGQTPTAFTLSITQVPAMQPACGNRTFSSPLCIESSSMSLDTTLSTDDKVFDAVTLKGDFTVYGTELNNGELQLSGAGINMFGSVDVSKSLHDFTISGDHTGSATMQR